MTAGKRIHLVFKTHLDIGFTDHAAAVRRQYHEQFIPQAIRTGEHFFSEDSERPLFVWTTGAWLIWDYLNARPAADVARLERAIGRGLIRWHGLPFTTHSELMSPAVFRAGLSFSQELDARFGVRTVAAKMTDVPGHTLGIVPLLAAAGIRFLHLGVNTASPPPEVPDLFRWRAPGGEEVVVMYQRSYGETQFPDGFDAGLGFAHTSDNLGPQSVPQVAEVYRDFAREHPGIEVVAGTLEDYAAVVWPRREELPVVTEELGDSWIHGTASDPVKLARFRALQRLYDGFEAEGLDAGRRAFGRGLTLVAEHTWGVDIKSYLRDGRAWDREAFEAARGGYRFEFTEESWAEQRRYLDAAVAGLGEADRERAEAALAAPAVGSGRGGWRAEAADNGDVVALVAPDGREIKGLDGVLIGFRHESYDAGDMARHMDTYLTHREEWAVLDHDKPGLAGAGTARSAVWAPGEGGEMPAEAVAELGAPASVGMEFDEVEQGVMLTVRLRGKAANRMPEAGFLSFAPEGAGDWRYLKTGVWLPAERVARRGGQQHAVFAVSAGLRDGGRVEVAPLDAALVAPKALDFMTFSSEPPDLGQGVRFNLYNNKWGTNFPMWWEGDLVSRFLIRVVP